MSESKVIFGFAAARTARVFEQIAALFARVLLLIVICCPAAAQLVSDQVPRERTIPRSDEIQKELTEDRYHFGPIRFRPMFDLHDSGYDNNVFGTATDPVSDWHTTMSAGANLILPVGRKVFLTGTAQPEYTWYRKLAARRLFGGEYGGSVVGLFNRLSIEGGGSTEKTVAPVNSEIERSVPGNRDVTFARTEVDVFNRLSIFAAGQTERQRYEQVGGETLPGITRLDRDDSAVAAGLRYRIRSYFDFAVSAQSGKTRFVSATESDNSTRAVLFGFHYDRPKFFLNVSAGPRKSVADGPHSTFRPLSTVTGSYYAAYALTFPLTIDLSGHRSAVYGLFDQNAYFLEQRTGIGFTLPAGQRVGLRAFSEIGDNSYPVLSGGVYRKDKVTVVGGGVAYRLYRNLTLAIVASDSRSVSNVESYTRRIFRVASTISMRGGWF